MERETQVLSWLEAHAELSRDYSTQFRAGALHTEILYRWADVTRGTDVFEQKTAFSCYIRHSNPYYENEKSAFIEDYLHEHGIYSDPSGSVTYNHLGMPLIERYSNADNNSFSFIVYLRYPEYSDYEDFKICCLTVHPAKSDIACNILYSYDTETRSTQEHIFDLTGAEIASISYEHIPAVPLSFITECSDLDEGLDIVDAALYRNQIFWLYKDCAQFDSSGRFTGYSGSYSLTERLDYFQNLCILFYDSDGRLEAIREELDADGRLLREQTVRKYDEVWVDYPPDFFYGYDEEIEFRYYENGAVSHINYYRPWPNSGGGDIYFDEMGRILYIDQYITHGSHHSYFLYDGASTRPWAYINWCSTNMCWFDEIYIFQQVE